VHPGGAVHDIGVDPVLIGGLEVPVGVQTCPYSNWVSFEIVLWIVWDIMGVPIEARVASWSQRYDETLEAFPVSLSPELRQQYLSPSDAEVAIGQVVHAQRKNFPRRLLDTGATGLLHVWDAQINVFKTSIQYKELLPLTVARGDRRLDRIEEAITYFSYAMVSGCEKDNGLE
jgi:hypothetical protein